MLPELAGKRLELLKEIVPKLSRVAILWNSANPAKAPDWKGIQVAARTLGVALYPAEVRGPDDFERAFDAMSREKLDALLTLDDPLTGRYRTQIVDFAAKKRLPAVYSLSWFVAAGGLMAYGVDLSDLLRRAATYVDKILKGAKPADLPVEQPTKFELAINLKTAKTLGLRIPPSMLMRADKVIE
jgi:putative ABC transport system substrate-binding protein